MGLTFLVTHKSKMGEFQHTLFGCCDNGAVWCIKLYFCTPCTNGYVAESVGENCWLHCLCACIMQPFLRQRVEENKSIDPAGGVNFAIGWCCAFCSIAQLAAECGIEP